MAQKTNPIIYRNLQNFEDASYEQQSYKGCTLPYVISEQRKVLMFLQRFFNSLNLVLHSFKYVKSSVGTVFIAIKYTSALSPKEKKAPEFKMRGLRFSTLEEAFLYGLSVILPTTPIKVSFFLLDKENFGGIAIVPGPFRGSPFAVSEHLSNLKILLTKKGSAPFLASIISTKLQKMRSRFERKSQSRFLSFLKTLLSCIQEKNAVCIQGLRINIKGRVNGAPRSKFWVAHEGKMSLQRVDNKIDYFYLPSETVYGTFGIKVWINYRN